MLNFVIAEKSKDPWFPLTILSNFSREFLPNGAEVFVLSIALSAIVRSFSIRSAEKPGIKSLSAGLFGPTPFIGQ